jgi:F0F1-type ATP synthase assembly protein I
LRPISPDESASTQACSTNNNSGKSQLAKNYLEYHIAGVGFFLGFLTSLFLRCWPFAMIALLIVVEEIA